jgi:hypothetical protein
MARGRIGDRDRGQESYADGGLAAPGGLLSWHQPRGRQTRRRRRPPAALRGDAVRPGGARGLRPRAAPWAGESAGTEGSPLHGRSRAYRRGDEQWRLHFGGEHDHRLGHRPHLRRGPDLGHPPRSGARAREAHPLGRRGGRARLPGRGRRGLRGFEGGGGTSILGDLLVVVATVCWGSYAVLSLPLLRAHSPPWSPPTP